MLFWGVTPCLLLSKNRIPLTCCTLEIVNLYSYDKLFLYLCFDELLLQHFAEVSLLAFFRCFFIKYIYLWSFWMLWVIPDVDFLNNGYSIWHSNWSLAQINPIDHLLRSIRLITCSDQSIDHLLRSIDWSLAQINPIDHLLRSIQLITCLDQSDWSLAQINPVQFTNVFWVLLVWLILCLGLSLNKIESGFQINLNCLPSCFQFKSCLIKHICWKRGCWSFQWIIWEIIVIIVFELQKSFEISLILFEFIIKL